MLGSRNQTTAREGYMFTGECDRGRRNGKGKGKGKVPTPYVVSSYKYCTVLTHE